MFGFILIVKPLDGKHWEEYLDPLCEAGCDDTSIGEGGNTLALRFDRGGCTLGHAIDSAITDVKRAIRDVEIEEIFIQPLSNLC